MHTQKSHHTTTVQTNALGLAQMIQPCLVFFRASDDFQIVFESELI